MEAPPARDQPAPTPGPPGAPGGQASPRLTLGRVILPPEQGLAPAVFLKALPIPLYHTVPPGGLQPRAPLVTGSADGAGLPFLLGPLLQPEGPGKPPAPTLTVSIVGALPVLSPGLGPPLGSPGKARNAGKHLCPHCGRDCLKPSVLEKHVRSHTGERPFPCATCGIAFKTQSNLYKHRRTQTHLNNVRLSSGAGPLEEGDKAEVAAGADQEARDQGVGDGAPERPRLPGAPGAGPRPPPTTHLPLVARSPDAKTDAPPCPRPTSADRETPLGSPHGACPGAQPRWKLPGQKSPTASKPCPLQRQQATSWEKPWEPKGDEGRLRKCESTDSGYLSRSDSAEQPPAPASPLHSPSEHRAGPEGGPGSAAEPGQRAATLALEKKQLEERIARLISHNQAVVEDPQLATVRPRKTILSQQGSLDLPTPYTYKDSFHFDLRALDPGRGRQATLGSARAAGLLGDRARPLFFHSVPTQFSTTVDCGPVTRSNSLPLVEGTRTWREAPGPKKQGPPSPRPAPARLGCGSGLTWAGGPSTHARALVRQAAVEDLPGAPAGDTPAPAKAPGGTGGAAGDAEAGKGGTAGKKGGRRKPKRFSQEKWQVYGDETFKRIYQKMKASHHGGKKGREARASGATEPGPWPRAEAAQGAAEPGDAGAPVRGGATCPPAAASVGAQPGPWGREVAHEIPSATEPPQQKEPVARVGGSDPPRLSRAASLPPSSCRDAPCLGSKSPSHPPGGRPEPGGQLARGVVLPDPAGGGTPGEGGEEEASQWAQSTLTRPGRGSGTPQPMEDKLPSERKKLKVEGLSSQENAEPPGAGGGRGETPGGPAQPAAPPPRRRDRVPPLEPQGADVEHCVGGCSLQRPHPEAPDGSSTQPRAPGPPAQADAFSPKYLLRLPQREAHPPLPGPRPGQEPLCKQAWPEELAPFAGPGLGAPLSPSAAAGRTPSEADSVVEASGWSRPWDGIQGTQAARGSGASTPAAGGSRGTAVGALTGTAAFTHPPARDSVKAPDSEGDVSPGEVVKPWPPKWELQGPPEKARRDPTPGPLVGLAAGYPLQPGSFLWAVAQPQGPPRVQPQLASPLRLGTPQNCGAEGPFPSLKAEPRLTWCCLGCSSPVPAEREGASRLHPAAGSCPGRAPDARPLSKAVPGGRIRTSLGDGGPAQLWKLSCPIAPGMTPQDRVSEPEWKKGAHRRRPRTSRGSSKQKKRRIGPKRYRGSFLQRRGQTRAGRLHRVVPTKSCHPPRLERLDPSRIGPQVSSEVAGLNLQGEPSCATSESSLYGGNEEKNENYCRPNSGTFSPSTGSRNVMEREKLSVKNISPSAGEHGDNSQSTTPLPELSLQSDSCLAEAKDNLAPHGKGLGVGLLETQLLLSQEQVPVDAKPCIFSDAQEPFSSDSQGSSPNLDVATSAAAICTSPGTRAGHATLGIPTAEPQGHNWAVGESLAQSPPGRKATPSPLPEKPLAGQRLSCSVSLGSTGKTHLEISALGPSSKSSHQEEGRDMPSFPSRGQFGYGEKVTPCPTSGNKSGQCQVPGLISDSVIPSNPGQPTEIPEAPSKTIKKRSLEGMRKQTRVEFSDTSSDDEDRLVIEI
ncbi:zinc finger protein 831 [Dasypus novemcinctus]|uniref:zinc finger protein 831 n=1 Tax=Dasypus novemcinctus TaxID=9361 RepID=UPI00032902BD|nr:zinc finger protein 831 [Dasypus novemcinctus]